MQIFFLTTKCHVITLVLLYQPRPQRTSVPIINVSFEFTDRSCRLMISLCRLNSWHHLCHTACPNASGSAILYISGDTSRAISFLPNRPILLCEKPSYRNTNGNPVRFSNQTKVNCRWILHPLPTSGSSSARCKLK